MHSLALALARRGDQVTGSDDAIFEPSRSRLESAGLLPEAIGWFPEKITEDLDGVVLGMHARADNPELRKAQSMGLNIWSYPEFLHATAEDKTRVVVGGSHGKTTTTAMLLHVLQHVGLPTDYMVGAALPQLKHTVNLTEDNAFAVFEGDEYLSSPIDLRPKFHLYQANVAILTGMAWDHVNVFPTEADYEMAFSDFLDSMMPGGALVYCQEDQALAQLVEAHPAPIKKFPYQTPPHRIESGQWIWETPLGDVPLQFMGAHNLANAEGARWLALEMGVQEQDFYEAIASFQGAQRRLERLATGSQRTVTLDFAHAPSKVRASSQAFAKQNADHNAWAVLELHTFSSLNAQFIPQYEGALDAGLDRAIVYYDPKAVAHKKLPELDPDEVSAVFGVKVEVMTDVRVLQDALASAPEATELLIMSSGNLGGWDVRAWAPEWVQ